MEFNRMGRVRAVVLGLGAILAWGCGGSAGSCTITNASLTTCIDYTGSGFSTDAVRAACVTPGIFSESECTESGRIGSCKVLADTAGEYIIRYLAGYNSTTAAQHCSTSTGTFTAN